VLRQRQPALSVLTFALIAPVFLLIIFGTMDIGRVLNAWLVITNEARETARHAAVTYDGTDDPDAQLLLQRSVARDYVAQRLNGMLDPAGVYRPPDVSFVPTGQNQSPLVQVTIYYRVELVTPLVSQVLPNPFPLMARSGMRGE
jgi:Flp pilus assembly protein TadG